MGVDGRDGDDGEGRGAGQAVPEERAGLLGGDSAAPTPLHARGRGAGALDRTDSNSLVPAVAVSFLHSRADHQEMLEWQEGGGEEAEQLQSDGLLPVAPAPTGSRKFDHPKICGIDKRPFFPTVLLVSLLWSVCMTRLQSGPSCGTLFLAMYSVTIGCAVYTSLASPGLLSEERYRQWKSGGASPPMRAHKHWLYKRPVLRFHQYCRWVTNCVGLHNHRSYMVMLGGFVTIAVVDAVFDFASIFVELVGGSWIVMLLLLLHLAYSVYFAWYATPLLRQHAAFVWRNELTQEWKRDDYYVVRSDETGEKISVSDLETDDYNRLFDHFEYDASRNPFDHGWVHNCSAFWFTSRTDPAEVGEF